VSSPELLHADLLVSGASEMVTPDPSTFGSVRRIEGGVVAMGGGKILAAGTVSEVAETVDISQALEVDAANGLVLPGFVDCHTHLLFGGSRAREYTARLTGDPAAVETLGIPTGIAASVGMTRAASDEQLLMTAMGRLDAMLDQGTTTVESKTGYGLSAEQELRLLRLNRQLESDHPIDVISTFMAAHETSHRAQHRQSAIPMWTRSLTKCYRPRRKRVGQNSTTCSAMMDILRWTRHGEFWRLDEQ